MNNNLIIKDFNGKEIHTFMWNGKYCWIANEIVSLFGYAEPKVTINQCIEAEQFEIGIEYEILKGNDLKEFKKLVKDSLTASKLISKHTSNLTIFYEDGLYGFLQYTDKPIGVEFRKWLRREVLPEIRETGTYISEGAKASNPLLDEYSKLSEVDRVLGYFNKLKENEDMKGKIKEYTEFLDLLTSNLIDVSKMFKTLYEDNQTGLVKVNNIKDIRK